MRTRTSRSNGHVVRSACCAAIAEHSGQGVVEDGEHLVTDGVHLGPPRDDLLAEAVGAGRRCAYSRPATSTAGASTLDVREEHRDLAGWECHAEESTNGGVPSRRSRRAGTLRVPGAAAGRAVDLERAVEGGDPVGETLQPLPRPGSAPPTPSSATSTTALPLPRVNDTRALDAAAYLATFASASETT